MLTIVPLFYLLEIQTMRELKKQYSDINSRMPRHSCCEVRVMQLHDILLLRTSAILPEAISAGGLTPTADTSLFLTTYRGWSHLPADIASHFLTYSENIHVFSYPHPVPGEMLSRAVVPVWQPQFYHLLLPESRHLPLPGQYMVPG